MNTKQFATHPEQCNQRLHAENKSYPKTCAVCKLGQCHGPQRKAEHVTESAPVPEVAVKMPSDMMHRVGRFRLANELIEHVCKGKDPFAASLLSDMLSQCFITRCEHDWATRSFEYAAMCADFDPIDPDSGLPAPFYTWHVVTDAKRDRKVLECRRCSGFDTLTRYPLS